MTGVTIITSSADMRSPLVTVCTFVVLWIDTIGGKIFVHGSEDCGGSISIKYGVFPRE